LHILTQTIETALVRATRSGYIYIINLLTINLKVARLLRKL